MINQFTQKILLAFFLTLAMGSAALAQGYEMSVRPFLVPTNDSVGISVRIFNRTSAGLQVGDARMTLSVNPQNVTIPGGGTITPSYAGRWTGSSAPGSTDPYLPLSIVATSGGNIEINIQRNPEARTAPLPIPPNQADSVVFKLRIRQCDATLGLTVNQAATARYLFLFNYQPANFQPGPGFIPPFMLKPPRRYSDVTYSAPARTTIRGAYCFNENITATVPAAGPTVPNPITANDSAVFYKIGPSDGAPVRLAGRRGPGTVTIPLNTTGRVVADGDSIFVRYRDNVCYYRGNGIIVNIDQTPLAPDIPQPLDAICTSDLVTNPTRTFTVNAPGPLVDNFVWTVTPAAAVTNIVRGVRPDQVGSSAAITFNPNFAGRVLISVQGFNACGGGPITRARLDLFSSVPVLAANVKPRLGLPGRTLGGRVCLNDTSVISVWKADTARFGKTYEMQVNPALAVRSITQYSSSAGLQDSTMFRIVWNRFYQGDSAWVKYRSANACGNSVWSDSVLVQFNRLPNKPSAPAGPDSTCQRTDSTLFTALSSPEDRVDTANIGYFWFVQPVAAMNGNYPLPPTVQPTLSPTNHYESKKGQVYIKWNPNFYGWVRIVVAANSKDCKGLAPNDFDFYYNFPGIPPAPNGLGDTASRLFFVKPQPLRTNRPVGERAFCLATAGSLAGTSTQICVRRGTYSSAVKFIATKNGQPLAAGEGAFVVDSVNFAANDTACVTFTFGANLTPGIIRIRTKAANICGVSDTSQWLSLFVNTVAPLRQDTIAQLNPRVRRPSAATRTERFSLCRGVGNVTYGITNAQAAYYRWEVSPAAAGTLVPTQGQFDSTTITVAYNPTYVGPVTLKAFPINGCNRNDPSQQNTAVDSVRFNIYNPPTAIAGNSVTNVPLGARSRLGGAGATAIPGLPAGNTASGGSGSYIYNWQVNPAPATPAQSPFVNSTNNQRGDVSTDPNPWFDPLADGNFTVTLTVTDAATGCSSAPITTTLSYSNAGSLDLRVFLQGAMRAPAVMGNDLQQKGLLNIFNNSGTGGPGTNPVINPGQRVPNGVVDFVTIKLRTSAIGSVAAEGYVWLMTDGSVRDFYTGASNKAIIPGAGNLVGNASIFVTVEHRNHLPITSSVPITLMAANATPGTTAITGFIDMRDAANVYGVRARTNGIGAVRLATGSVAAIAGNVINTFANGLTKREINSADWEAILRQTLPQIDVYSDFDANLNGVVNQDDEGIIRTNSDRLYYSLVP